MTSSWLWGTGTPIAQFAQGMGTTDANGFVVSFPFNYSATNVATVPVQIWVDAVNGSDANNGFSPYLGNRLNGTGTNFQSGATGAGSTAAGYGPKASFFAAYSLISGTSGNRIGNQIFLMEGQSFNEGFATFTASISGTTVTVTQIISGVIGANQTLSGLGVASNGIKALGTIDPNTGLPSTGTGGVGTYVLFGSSQGTIASERMFSLSTDSMNFRSGFSIAYPFCIQSCPVPANTSDPSPLNTALQGRATGTNRPTMATYVSNPQFQGAISGNTLIVSSVSGGTIMQGQTLSSASVIPGTKIISGSGTTWTVDTTQTFVAETMTSTGVGQSYSVIDFYATDNPLTPVRGNFAIRGIHFNSGTGDATQVIWVGNPYNVLLENCVFEQCGLGIGPGSHSVAVANNIIMRHCSVGGDYSSAAAHTAGFGTGTANGLVIENCIVYHGGWPLAASARQISSFQGTMTGNTITVVSGLVGTPGVGQILGFIGQNSSNTYIVTGVSGSPVTSITVNGGTDSSSGATFITRIASYPDIFKQGLYMSFGSTDTSICRRCVITDNSASGLSGRGSLFAYNNVLIDNPIQMVAGGSVNQGAQTVATLSNASVSGSTLTVSGNIGTVQGLPSQNSAIFNGHYLSYQDPAWVGNGTISGTSFTVNSTTSGSVTAGMVIQGGSLPNLFSATAASPLLIVQSGSGPNWTLATTGPSVTQAMTGTYMSQITGETPNAPGGDGTYSLISSIPVSPGSTWTVASSSALNGYNNANGIVTLTINTPSFPSGTSVVISGLTGTGSVSSLDGTFTITSRTDGATTSTITYQATSGLGSITITGGTLTASGFTNAVMQAPGFAAENPAGINFNYNDNLIMGGADINAILVRGQGIATENGLSGSGCAQNLFINNPDYSQGVAFIFASSALAQPSHYNYSLNAAYDYYPTLDSQSAAYPLELFPYYGNSSSSPGNNTLSATSNYTNAQIYTALGYPDKATMMAAMIAAPELNWAYTVLQTVGPLFNNFPFQYS